MKYQTSLNVTLTLTPERRKHIIDRHPIMEPYLKNLKEVLEKPDEIRYSSRSDNTLLFYRFFANIENGKYIVVVVNWLKSLITTAYLTDRIKIGRKYENEEKF